MRSEGKVFIKSYANKYSMTYLFERGAVYGDADVTIDRFINCGENNVICFSVPDV